ncbi:hypothetical protein DOTSEDRAFT_53513 [Dothistroma septosporum NZE10]|uniref:Uncharacterized protein n=1 Tax=Dothistroma septosporum (strain NZE10 / CBS 128990) TaxID=675120 RepID=N1PLL9_DOTSN|nr:hypothetical protein DOTSEDRAFT_53513 [Dothistroma septosporum NZE10]
MAAKSSAKLCSAGCTFASAASSHVNRQPYFVSEQDGCRVAKRCWLLHCDMLVSWDLDVCLNPFHAEMCFIVNACGHLNYALHLFLLALSPLLPLSIPQLFSITSATKVVVTAIAEGPALRPPLHKWSSLCNVQRSSPSASHSYRIFSSMHWLILTSSGTDPLRQLVLFCEGAAVWYVFFTPPTSMLLRCLLRKKVAASTSRRRSWCCYTHRLASSRGMDDRSLRRRRSVMPPLVAPSLMPPLVALVTALCSPEKRLKASLWWSGSCCLVSSTVGVRVLGDSCEGRLPRAGHIESGRWVGVYLLP